MRLLLAAAVLPATLGLVACQVGSGDQQASDRAVEEAGGAVNTMQRTTSDGPAATTGAGGATTSASDPNPAGQGATTGATPGDATGSLNSTPTAPGPPPQSPRS